MSLRLEMLQIARLAPNLLEEAAGRVIEYLQSQVNENGGVRDRSGSSDLYYTVFGLQGLIALQAPLPEEQVRTYLLGFGAGENLDFVHRCCLARCWACLNGPGLEPEAARALLGAIESCRSADGGYAAASGSERGTVYHSFLALGAYQDLGARLPDPGGLRRCAEGLATADGAFANDPGLEVGTTPATAAAATLLRHLEGPVPVPVGEWLLARCLSGGGFVATPAVSLPDLLSTATALHALSGLHVSFEPVRESCLDFVDTLWTGRAFCGSWADQEPDPEYTFYALLALGHLSL